MNNDPPIQGLVMSRDERLSPLVELTRVRLLEFLREPEAVFWTFVFPILLATGLGVAFRSRPADVVKVAVPAASTYRERLMGVLSRDSGLEVVALDDSALTNALRVGSVAMVIDLVGDTAHLRFDEARPEARSARLLVERTLNRSLPGAFLMPIRESLVSERGSRYIDFVLPGLLAMNLMGSGIWGIGFSIVDARRKKLLKRFIATPMNRAHYLASFLVLRLALMSVEVVVISLFGILAFGVPMRGPLIVYCAVVLLATLAFGSIGLLIASRARTVEAASGMMNVVMLPMWVGSGVFFSAANFPDVVQPLIQSLPLTAAVDGLRLNMLQGAGWSAVAGELGVLILWLAVCFTLALRLFRWR
ncbi:MAG: ABC transporter permease [Gemmatimonadota bacterium]